MTAARASRVLVGAPLALLVALVTALFGYVPPAAARECATVRLLDAARRGALPNPRAALQTRPASVGFVDSARFPIRAHYPDVALEARARTLLAALEDAWARQVEERGYPRPLPDGGEGGDDRLDAYLDLVAPAAAVTLAHEDVDASDGRHASYAHLVVDPSVPDAELGPLVHHELAHAIQFGIDRAESLMFFEASAVAEEYLLDESLGFPTLSWASDLDDFQAAPHAAPFTDGIALRPLLGTDGYYEYGAALFLLYLEQTHGAGNGALLRELWLASVQPDDVEANEPDWLDALAREVPVPLSDLTLDFATWRALVAGWALDDDGLRGAARLSSSAALRARRLATAALDGSELTLDRAEQPQQHGCFTFETTAPAGRNLSLRVHAASLPDDGETRPLGVAFLVGDPSEGRARREAHERRGDALDVDVALRGGETGLVAVCDLGGADADDAPSPRPIRVRVARADEGLADAGPQADDAGPRSDGGLDDAPPPESWGCQAAPASPSSSGRGRSRPLAFVLMSLVGMLIFVVRLVRVRKRRKLYQRDAARRRS